MKTSVLATLALATTGLASPFPEDFNATATVEALRARGIQPGTGTHGGYYYSFWTDGAGNIDFNNLDGGSYSCSWSGNGNWVGGKGWNPGSDRYVMCPSLLFPGPGVN